MDWRPGRCGLSFSLAQSAIGNDVLSKGSAHLGSPSDLHTQHFIESPEVQLWNDKTLEITIINHIIIHSDGVP